MNAEIANTLAQYWFLFILAGATVVALFLYNKSLKAQGGLNEQQKENIKEWLKAAVFDAEKELGAKTGQLKLRKVYGWAVDKFPALAAWVSFETFSDWVDDALEWMDAQIMGNPRARQILENGGSE